jgi:hypothetical protein
LAFFFPTPESPNAFFFLLHRSCVLCYHALMEVSLLP